MDRQKDQPGLPSGVCPQDRLTNVNRHPGQQPPM